jgi:hypothetical protein
MGEPSRATKITGAAAVSGRDGNFTPLPAKLAARDNVAPRTSTGIWICDSLPVAASTGARTPPARTLSTCAPRMLTSEPGATARTIMSAALTTRGSRKRCGASVEYTP